MQRGVMEARARPTHASTRTRLAHSHQKEHPRLEHGTGINKEQRVRHGHQQDQDTGINKTTDPSPANQIVTPSATKWSPAAPNTSRLDDVKLYLMQAAGCGAVQCGAVWCVAVRVTPKQGIGCKGAAVLRTGYTTPHGVGGAGAATTTAVHCPCACPDVPLYAQPGGTHHSTVHTTLHHQHDYIFRHSSPAISAPTSTMRACTH